MRTSHITGVSLALVAGLALALPACQEGGEDDPVYAVGGTGATSVGGSSTDNTSGTGTGGSVLPQGGSGTQAGSPSGGGSETVAGSSGVAGSGTQPVGGSDSGGSGTGGSGTAGSGTGGGETGGTGTGGSSAGTGTGGTATGGTGMGGTGTAGSGGGASQAVGRFKMLAYCETRGFPHTSIRKGLEMLKALGAANDFEVVVSDGDQTTYTNDPQITATDLASFDMAFFMNTTGDIFNAAEQTAFMNFLKEKKAFAGVHSATDTEPNWTWYEELVGENYDGHPPGAPQQGTITIEQAVKDHPAVAGISSPWTRNEEWYLFANRVGQSNLPGLTVLLRFSGPQYNSGATVGQPLAWTREWEGIRSFYTALGHADSAFDEANIKKHVLGGILWAVGRVK